MTIFDDNWENILKEQSLRLVTWDLTLETLISFLTFENNNVNNYIVTFDTSDPSDKTRHDQKNHKVKDKYKDKDKDNDIYI